MRGPIPAAPPATVNATDTQMPPIPPHIGKYQVIERLRAGGMGVLYLARDARLGRNVAIKLIRADIDSPDLRERFEQEAQAVSRLRHPNVVTVFDYGEFEGQPYLVMEYIEGESLAALIARRAPLSVERKLRLMDDVCAGMACVHAAKLVHRDLKPDNLMLDRGADTVKILDFGIARRMEEGPSGFTQGIGTPGYMAPEQIAAGTVNRRSDVFAMGAILYELLTFRRAFDGASQAEVVHKILHEEPAPVLELCPDLDARVGAVVHKALAKAPANRFRDVDDFRAALTAASTPAVETADTSSRGRRLGAAAALTLLIAGYGVTRFDLTDASFKTDGDTSVPCPEGGACSALEGDTNRERGVTPDMARAIVLYQKACDGGAADACNDLGALYEDGSGGLTQDLALAVALFRKACDGGSADGCSNLGFRYGSGGGGLPTDPARAVALYEQACDNGSGIGCHNLAVGHEEGYGGLAKNLGRAAALYQEACGYDGGAESCTRLGFHLENGTLGLTRDATRAVTLYRQACDGGSVRGCNNLGVAYANGDGGLVKDVAAAVALYQMACDGGDAIGCTNLGRHYHLGDGLPKDLARAAALYQQGCDGGHAVGCHFLAALHEP